MFIIWGDRLMTKGVVRHTPSKARILIFCESVIRSSFDKGVDLGHRLVCLSLD